MDIPRNVRKDLDALSKAVFGVSSRWQRYIKGIPELVTKKVVETVPGDKGQPDTTKEVQVPVLLDGAKQFKTKFYTIEEVTQLLLKFKAIREEAMAAQLAAQKLQEAQKRVQEQAGGIAKA